MTRKWKPGDVAMVGWTTSHGLRRLDMAFRTPRSGWLRHDDMFIHDDKVCGAHPLVVIDADDSRQVERLAKALGIGTLNWHGTTGELQAALRSLVAPPRIDEPGMWSVVEAACVHSDERVEWVRWSDGNWYRTDGHHVTPPDDWDSLVDPTLIREGVR